MMTLAMPSSTGVPRKMMRSIISREKMSNWRSPRAVCSMTVGYGMIEFCMANNYSIFAASKGVKLFLLRPNNSGGNRLATSGVCCKTADAMRILALDHGTKRIGVAVSDETKTIAQPLEYIPAEPFGDFLE